MNYSAMFRGASYSDSDYCAFLEKFTGNIDKYAMALGINKTEISTLKSDAAYLNYLVNVRSDAKQFVLDMNRYIKLMRHTPSFEILTDLPELKAIFPPPYVTPGNIHSRVRKIINKVLKSPNYTTAIGTDLGIITDPDSYNPPTAEQIANQTP